MENKTIHLSGLNDIRAIAALSVVISHILLGLENFGLAKVAGGWNFASYVVTMFFTLSGFLITFLLIKEKKTFNTISIKQFYIRRALRIWPLYYFYTFLVLLILIITFPEELPGATLYYLFMGGNHPFVMGLSLTFLEHFWSLGVEEQFYLFWPWLVKWFSPLKSISLFLLIFFSVKLILRILIPNSFWYQLICVTRFDCMAIGACGAIYFDAKNKLLKYISFSIVAQVVSWIIVILAATGKLLIPDFINQNVFSFAVVIIILNVAFNKSSLILLENKFFNFFGKISFGLYVYHPLVIYFLGLGLKELLSDLNTISQLAIIVSSVLVMTVLVAWIFYEFFEKKFIIRKLKYSKVHSTA